MFCFKKWLRNRRIPKSSTPKARLHLETLEDRTVPYALSGSSWAQPQLVTIGIVPDGTDLGGVSSNLISNFNARFSLQSYWMNQILKAAQVWAQQTNLNFALVADNGAAIGSGSYQQGDPLMADIRIGGYDFGSTTLARSYLPPQANNFSIAGDIHLNTAQTWVIGTTGGYDVFTVAMHEIGHALGLNHSSSYFAAMYPYYAGSRADVGTDDAIGIRAVYSGGAARAVDSFDAGGPNNTFASATIVDSLINPVTLLAVAQERDITTTADADYYKFTAPQGSAGPMNIKVQSTGRSLLAPTLSVYNSSQQLIGEAAATGQYAGSTLSLSFSGVTPGMTFYVKVTGADTSAFGTGKYALGVSLGQQEVPYIPAPVTATANGTPLTSSGGSYEEDGMEYQVSSPGVGDIQTTDRGFAGQAVGMDAAGNHVIAWSNRAVDNSGWDVYAQRFDANGVAQGDPFRVNTATLDDQFHATVSMNASGNFVIAWESYTSLAGGGVFARLYDAQGGALTDEINLAGDDNYEQGMPTVAMDDAGNFVATWTVYGQDNGGLDWGVYARRFDATGQPLSDEFRVNDTVAGQQMYSTLAVNATGDFVITWTSLPENGEEWDVYAKRYNAEGEAQGDEFRVNTTTDSDQTAAAVALGPNGNFVIVWASLGQDGDGWGVFAQLYDAQGEAQGNEFMVSRSGDGAQYHPAVAMDPAGNFVVSWSGGFDDESRFDVYVRHFNSAGVAHAEEIMVNNTSPWDQYASSLAMDAAGNFIVVWNGNGPGDFDGVFAQRYSVEFPDGNGGFGDGMTPDGCEDGHDHGHADGCGCSDCVDATIASVSNVIVEDLVVVDSGSAAEPEEVSSDLEASDAWFAEQSLANDIAGASEELTPAAEEQPV